MYHMNRPPIVYIVILFAAVFFNVMAANAVEPVTGPNQDLAGKGLKGKVRRLTEKWRIAGLLEKQQYSYDTNGKLIEHPTYIGFLLGPVFLLSRTTYIYNDAGDRLTQVSYNRRGEQKSNGIYVSDSNHRIIEYSHYEEDFRTKKITRSWHYLYKYDAQGRLTETVYAGSADSTPQVITYEYDEKGNMKRRMDLTSQGDSTDIWLRLYQYDDNGNVIREESYQNGSPYDYTMFEYNSFDRAGNWTKRTRYRDGQKLWADKRRIKYY